MRHKLIYPILALIFCVVSCSTSKQDKKDRNNKIFEALLSGNLDSLNTLSPIYDYYADEDLTELPPSRKIKSEGNQISRSFPLSSKINRIANYLPIDVTFVVSDTPGITISGSEVIINDIEYSQKGNLLSLNFSSRNKYYNGNHSATITVALPSLTEISNYGAGDFYADFLNYNSLKIYASGAGKIKINTVYATLLTLLANGAGDININNIKVNTLKALGQGAGDFKFKRCEAISFNTTIQGAGNLQVESLSATLVDATIQGAGDVTFSDMRTNTFKTVVLGAGDLKVRGEANSANLTVHGAGSIHATSLKCNHIQKQTSGAGEIKL